MRPIAVIDAETDPFRKGRIPQPFVWGYYNGSMYQQFEKTADLIAFISERDELIYAHNGGKFDFHYLLSHLSAYDDLTIINGRIARCNIGIAELRDSWCIINEPLSKYKKDVIDYSIMESDQRHKRGNWLKICKYLKSDCVYLWEMVSEFVRRFGPELTQASAAMKQWRKLSNDPHDKTDEEFYNALSPFYYGGRVQCFRSGIIDTDFDVYDINSAYAFAMMQKHPYSANYERISGYAKDSDFYVVDCISRGALPYRGDGGNNQMHFGLSFPNDETHRTYFVSGWELSSAKDTKSVERIKYIESIRFMRHVSFADYINKFWAAREVAKKAGDILGTLFNKLMMNSLYGKFAANPDNYHNFMIVPPSDAEAFAAGQIDGVTGGWQFGGELGPWLLAQKELDEWQKRYYNVATGASITGYVRAMLWRAIHSSTGVLYCDTDSIAVKRKGGSVSLGNKLGEWKHEGCFDRAGIAGKKLYIFRGLPDKAGKRIYKTASKGARLTHAELWKVARGGTVAYESEVPTYSVAKTPFFTNREIKKTA